MPAKQESKHIESGELELFEAVKGKAIIYSDLNDLRNVFKVVMLKVGLSPQNLPGKEETALLIDHVLKNYGKHTNAEIRLAFDMALAGKLNIEENNVKCYGNFSCIYFSGIMNAFREWAKNKNVYKEEIKQNILTDEEIENEIRGEIEIFFQSLKKGYQPILHTYFEDVLKKDGFIRYEETVKDFFKRAIECADKLYSKD